MGGLIMKKISVFIFIIALVFTSCELNDKLVFTRINDEMKEMLLSSGMKIVSSNVGVFNYAPDMGLDYFVLLESNEEFLNPEVINIKIKFNGNQISKQINKTYAVQYEEKKQKYVSFLNVFGSLKIEEVRNLLSITDDKKISKKKAYKELLNSKQINIIMNIKYELEGDVIEETISQDFNISRKKSLAWFDDAMSI